MTTTKPFDTTKPLSKTNGGILNILVGKPLNIPKVIDGDTVYIHTMNYHYSEIEKGLSDFFNYLKSENKISYNAVQSIDIINGLFNLCRDDNYYDILIARYEFGKDLPVYFNEEEIRVAIKRNIEIR